MSTPKSASRIEIWRDEVSAEINRASSGTTIRPPKSWEKILRRRSQIDSGRRSRKEKDAQLKTGMYDSVGSIDEMNGERNSGSSMDLGSGESDLGAFRERRERLERAARLLNRGGGRDLMKEVGERR